MDIRVGQGIDVHPFAEGRRCVIGGVEIPHSKGLLGHSDADVLVHAVMDAILGATGSRDIGALFPDTDVSFKDADSCLLLKRVWDDATEKGWRIVNLDISLLAQVPKISPYVETIRERLSGILTSEISRIGIKATTTESMGFIGREEGVMAFAVVLLQREEGP
jgi:2-C-methyl-D-erythritol 2,4-cyclodiphosphate synthase